MPQQRPIRARVDIEVGADLASGDVAVVRNVSLSGCLLVTRAKLKESQRVALAVPRPPGDDLRVTGTVVRRQGDGAGGWEEYGVRFDPLGPEGRRELALVVAEGVESAPPAGADGV
jgi:hypothetical protein